MCYFRHIPTHHQSVFRAARRPNGIAQVARRPNGIAQMSRRPNGLSPMWPVAQMASPKCLVAQTASPKWHRPNVLDRCVERAVDTNLFVGRVDNTKIDTMLLCMLPHYSTFFLLEL